MNTTGLLAVRRATRERMNKIAWVIIGNVVAATPYSPRRSP
jgi:hypothetical protein